MKAAPGGAAFLLNIHKNFRFIPIHAMVFGFRVQYIAGKRLHFVTHFLRCLLKMTNANSVGWLDTINISSDHGIYQGVDITAMPEGSIQSIQKCIIESCDVSPFRCVKI
jgi:hypothetical protein